MDSMKTLSLRRNGILALVVFCVLYVFIRWAENDDVGLVHQYVVTGTNINCLQKPLSASTSQLVASDADASIQGKYAYVWYATTYAYLCSALVAMLKLKSLRNEKSLQVDYVLVVTGLGSRNDPDIDETLIAWTEKGGIIKKFQTLWKRPRGKEISVYDYSFNKFHAFNLVAYDRVIALDSDGIPLKDLDHLFLMDFPPGVSLAAPQGYWFRNQGVSANASRSIRCTSDVDSNKAHLRYTTITSVLLVIKPNWRLFQRVVARIGTFFVSAKEDGAVIVPYYDMDIINNEFSCNHEVLVLPKHYGTLDSDFDPFTRAFTKYQECRDISQVQYLHFTSRSKPWLRHKKKHKYADWFSEEVALLYGAWFKKANEYCPKLFTKTEK